MPHSPDRRGGHTVFIDGLGDEVTYQSLKQVVLKFGKVERVFLQRARRQGRRSRFGFARFRYAVDATAAVEGLNGVVVQDSMLVANKARYHRSSNGGSNRVMKSWRPKAIPVSQVPAKRMEWRIKKSREEVKKAREEVTCRGPLVFSSSMEDAVRMERLAIGTLRDVYTLEVVQDFVANSGLGLIRVKPLDSCSVILEFESQEELMFILREGREFLLQLFLSVESCSSGTCGSQHLVWVKLFNIPVKVWRFEFFEAVTAGHGRLVCLDDDTRDMCRFDVARVLLQVEKPWVCGKEIWVQVDNALHKVFMIPEVSSLGTGRGRAPVSAAGRWMSDSEVSDDDGKERTMYDYGGVVAMPTTPVKEYRSSSQGSSAGEGSDNQGLDGDFEGGVLEGQSERDCSQLGESDGERQASVASPEEDASLPETVIVEQLSEQKVERQDWWLLRSGGAHSRWSNVWVRDQNTKCGTCTKSWVACGSIFQIGMGFKNLTWKRQALNQERNVVTELEREAQDLMECGYDLAEISSIQKYKNLNLEGLEICVGFNNGREKELTWQKVFCANYEELFHSMIGWAKYLVGMQTSRMVSNAISLVWAGTTQKGNIRSTLLWGPLSVNQVDETISSLLSEVRTSQGEFLESSVEQEHVQEQDKHETLVDKVLQLYDSVGPRRRRGRPRKYDKAVHDLPPKRPRGRPRKEKGGGELASLFLDGHDQQLMHANLGSEDGITTRARRALIRSQNAGLILECSEEDAVLGIVGVITSGCRR